MKGIYERKAPQPKYNKIWDASVVLDYLASLKPVNELKLKDLTLKLLMLLLLVTGQRGQSMHLLNISTMTLNEKSCNFQLTSHTKTSKPWNPSHGIVVNAFEQNQDLCPVHTLKEYIKRTQNLRGNQNQLFISFTKPHKVVARDTISRWTKLVLVNSGVDTNTFKSHSTRAASASKARQKDVPLDVILSHVGWSTSSTFSKFYDKPIMAKNDIVSAAILNC